MSHSPGWILLCAYTIWEYCQISFSYTIPTQSYLVFYSFCANFLHLYIIWLIISYLSLHFYSIISLFHFSLWTWHIFVYSYCLFQNLQFLFFFIFCKQLEVIHVHKVINLFLWFCKFVAPSALPEYVIEQHHRLLLSMKTYVAFFCSLGF